MVQWGAGAVGKPARRKTVYTVFAFCLGKPCALQNQPTNHERLTMSHSTQVRVAIGSTTIEYTFGSGNVASNYGVYEIREPFVMTGDAAVGAIASSLADHSTLLPEHELQFARECLQRWLDFIREDTGQPDLDQRLLNQVAVHITRFD